MLINEGADLVPPVKLVSFFFLVVHFITWSKLSQSAIEAKYESHMFEMVDLLYFLTALAFDTLSLASYFAICSSVYKFVMFYFRNVVFSRGFFEPFFQNCHSGFCTHALRIQELVREHVCIMGA
jgi:hypothetical protein